MPSWVLLQGPGTGHTSQGASEVPQPTCSVPEVLSSEFPCPHIWSPFPAQPVFLGSLDLQHFYHVKAV